MSDSAKTREEWLMRLHDIARREAERQLRDGPLRLKEEPADLAQSVAREILEEGDALQDLGPEADQALVRKILANKIVEKYRYYLARKRDMRKERNRSAPALSSEGEDPASIDVADEGPGPGTVLGRKESLEQVRQRMRLLTAREREVFQLKMSGHSHDEIANLLGITAVNSARILCEARKKLVVP